MPASRKLSVVTTLKTKKSTASVISGKDFSVEMSVGHEAKLLLAKKYLGKKHCLHPEFDRRTLSTGLLDAWKAKKVART